MEHFTKVSNKEIMSALKNVTRQYLAGHLSRPQSLNHIDDQQLEIGITNYESFTTEVVHYHTHATEYQYMISGWTQYMDVDTGEVHEFVGGDFFAIHPGTTYAQKSKAGTRIIFIKVPSINDKHVVEVSEAVAEWYDQKLSTVRKDYAHQDDMPTANSIRPAASVAIVNDNKILMLKRRDNGKWTLPGGTMELTDSLAGCAVREVKEETGLDVSIIDIIGTYTDPDIRVAYSDGEVRREFTVVFWGHAEGHCVTIDEESCSYQWVPLKEVLKLPMAHSQLLRLQDTLKYLETGEKKMG